MTISREHGDDQPDFGREEHQNAYEEGIKKQREKARKEDEEKAKQEKSNKDGRKTLEGLNSKELGQQDLL